ncbi:MAG: pyridoxamine 5'-phosphate oxidase family protein [Thermoflexales bacterium]|nr:pyridoxamine 5'-phosphate oxidase family protein [Thermoflexales bacterium]
MSLSPEIERRLDVERNLWLATARADGTPHLIPVWFIWRDGVAWICTGPESVKARNLRTQPKVMFALEDGDKPALAAAVATRTTQPFPAEIVAAFKQKYNWDILTDADYGDLYALQVTRWLSWKPSGSA